jgi:DNA mismatch repair protein MutS
MTPMMTQWQECKKKAQGALLLFRLGDFYEAFEEDAALLSEAVDVALTKRQETPMAGIPAHMCETYVDRLVGKGFRVAIAEQVEDPKVTKGLVRREIVRIVTPGSVINSSLLVDKANNFMACVTKLNLVWGLALLDLTTADFRVMEFEEVGKLLDELVRFAPSEVVVSQKCANELNLQNMHLKEEWQFDHKLCLERLHKHFKVQTLGGFGLSEMTAAINAAGALLTYIQDDLHLSTHHLKKIEVQRQDSFMTLDRITQRHLELVMPIYEKGKTVLALLDKTVTPMGGRLLKEWLLSPLLNVEKILERQTRVEHYFNEKIKCSIIRKALKEVRDLERVMMRIETGHATPRDLAALRLSLEPLPNLSNHLHEALPDLAAVLALLTKALVDLPPLRLSDGGLFKEGYHPELDALSTLKRESQTWLAAYQTKLREELEIKTLKVGYTEAFGYFIEVSRGQSEKMPLTFQRRQTLVGSERFISPELKEFEHQILSAEDKLKVLERHLFEELKKEVSLFGEKIRKAALQIAKIDLLTALAEVARDHQFTKPIVDTSDFLKIEGGFHPVVAATLEKGAFIPNDTLFDASERLAIITGPNMAGKSTYIRQVALITLLAQIGSFVPAKFAHIGVVDKLFTRIGASDDLSRGLSTFMVEMSETANILNNATARSLIILDEIGRGTSTYDGIAIAWAVAESLQKAKTLFATHYFELTALEKETPGAVNLSVAVHESENGIVFLHKIVRGSADKSYGIHVAKLAGIPHKVVQRAEAILKKLHQVEKNRRKDEQLDFFR